MDASLVLRTLLLRKEGKEHQECLRIFVIENL